MKQDALPPSPPMTDQAATSGEGSPKTPMIDQTPKDTPPRSPGVESEYSGSSASSTRAALLPLPAEVFLNVLSFLQPDDLARMTRVSSAWRAVIDNEPRLWSSLGVMLDDDHDMRKVSYVCSRALGNGGGRSGMSGIRDLVVQLRYLDDLHGRYGDVIPKMLVKTRVNVVLKSVAWASIRRRDQVHAIMPFRPPSISTLWRLTLCLYPNTIASAHAFHEVAEWAADPVFSALKEVIVHASLPDFVFGGKVLSMFPTVSRLDMAFQPNGGRSQAVQSLPSLETLRWRYLTVLDLALPRLPVLRTLQLTRVRWVGRSFFLLLRIARRTLETVDLIDLVMDEPSDPFEDWGEFVDVRDPEFIDDPVPPLDDYAADGVPAPIRFPVLRRLTISGMTPPIFAPSTSSEVDFDLDFENFPTPLFVMPALKTCQLVETTFDDDLESISEIGQLAALGANAPRVEHLILNSIVIDDMAVCACLSNMSGAMTHLDLSESSISDHAILQLPNLVPKLETLDVRLCNEISCQGVARVVEVFLARTDSGWSKIQQVFLDPPSESWADWRAYSWLDFVGVLSRDDLDFEGDGPVDPQQRDQWKRSGKKDLEWQERRAWRKEHEMKVQMFAQDEAYRAANGGGSGAAHDGTSGAANGGESGSTGSLMTTSPFFPRHDAPPHLSQTSILRLPPIPTVLAPAPASLLPYAPPPRQGLYAFPPRADYQPPPIVVPQSIWQNAIPQPHQPQPQQTQRTTEEDGDYSYLDTEDGLDSVDPAVIEAQRVEYERLSQRHDNRLVSEADAYNAQRRRQQDAHEGVVTRVEEVFELHPALLVARDSDEAADEQVDEVLLDAEEELQPHLRGFAGDDSTEDEEDEKI
ncbi:F-box domain containing protein [Rhodotorula toruloides]|uniref:F-box domain containing protein n=1 Tax=Rhodotorula toruloides TaxID=5286 RepID=A0A511K703_RHOTO|nr:F-box domain containing protein [Rhodotorula toruloides]